PKPPITTQNPKPKTQNPKPEPRKPNINVVPDPKCHPKSDAPFPPKPHARNPNPQPP
ncbi:hypothetical protein T484DRAFT_1575220, partial [Baffinella frigidus]